MINVKRVIRKRLWKLGSLLERLVFFIYMKVFYTSWVLAYVYGSFLQVKESSKLFTAFTVNGEAWE